MTYRDLTRADLDALRVRNNPNGDPAGHYTGRCRVCHSANLWDDDARLDYGCDDCGAVFPGKHTLKDGTQV